MNAYELAEAILPKPTIPMDVEWLKSASNMLRQQADRIADHEKTFNEMCELYEKQLDKQADRIAELKKQSKFQGDNKVNDEPVAWIKSLSLGTDGGEFKYADDVRNLEVGTPLYTHPAKTCKHGVDDGACKECYQEATHPAKTLTDEEITELANKYIDWVCYDEGEYGTETELVGIVDFAKAILRKAQEK